MGEYADMMLDGTCCQCCGAYMHEFEAAPGYPVTCASCDDGPGATEPPPLPPIGKHVPCPDPTNGCERKFINRHAAAMHWIDKHK